MTDRIRAGRRRTTMGQPSRKRPPAAGNVVTRSPLRRSPPAVVVDQTEGVAAVVERPGDGHGVGGKVLKIAAATGAAGARRTRTPPSQPRAPPGHRVRRDRRSRAVDGAVRGEQRRIGLQVDLGGAGLAGDRPVPHVEVGRPKARVAVPPVSIVAPSRPPQWVPETLGISKSRNPRARTPAPSPRQDR